MSETRPADAAKTKMLDAGLAKRIKRELREDLSRPSLDTAGVRPQPRAAA